MSNKSKWIKAIGVAATVIGVGVNLILIRYNGVIEHCRPEILRHVS